MILYDNYDFENYEQMAKEWLNDNDNDEPTDEEIMWAAYELLGMDWEDIMYELKRFFADNMLIVTGTISRWNGSFEGGKIFESWTEAINSMMEDCEYCRIEDVNGELFITCSHHDGTNHFVVRKLTDKGYNMYNNWNYSIADKRSEETVMNTIMKCNLFSNRPWIAREIYGVK